MPYIFRIHLVLTAIAIVVMMVAAFRPSRAIPTSATLTPMHGIAVECSPVPCVDPDPMIGALEARDNVDEALRAQHLKHDAPVVFGMSPAAL